MIYFKIEEVWIAVTQKKATAQGNETTYTDHHIKIPMAIKYHADLKNEEGLS